MCRPDLKEHAGYKLLAERIRNAIQPASIHTIAHSSFEVAEGGDARENDSKTRLFTEVTSPDSHSPALLSARSPQDPGIPP